MSVISLVEASQAPLAAQAFYADGDPGPIVAALAHVPEVLEVTVPFLRTVLGGSSIPLQTKEIVILRTSVLLSCRYCTQTHTVVAGDAGLSRDEIRGLRDEAAVEAMFPDRAERALIAWVDAVALGPGSPPEPLVQTIATHFTEAQIAELTLLVGATLMLSRFATSLRLPTSTGTSRRLDEEGWE